MVEETKKMNKIADQITFTKDIYYYLQGMISLADSKVNISIVVQSLLITIGLGASLLIDTIQNLQMLNDIMLIFILILIVVVCIVSSFIGIGYLSLLIEHDPRKLYIR